MSDLADLETRIKEKLAARQEECVRQYNHHAERMHEWEQRHQRYTALADHVVTTVIRPRLERLAAHFENAELACGDQAGRHQCVCNFKHTPQFPATARLELGVSRDGQAETLILLYDLSILPVFFHFDGKDQLTMPLHQVDEAKAAAWVEEKILSFLDAYLRLENVDQYQSENQVTDPVCGMRINKLYAAGQAEHRGQTYYFCIPECKEKFASDPDRYLGAPSQT
jgi:YHS domain-containing protein